LVLAKRKHSRFDDRKLPNIRNMRRITIVKSRGLLEAKIPNFEITWVYMLQASWLAEGGNGIGHGRYGTEV
jgi:hypothetical protein